MNPVQPYSFADEMHNRAESARHKHCDFKYELEIEIPQDLKEIVKLMEAAADDGEQGVYILEEQLSESRKEWLRKMGFHVASQPDGTKRCILWV